MKKYIVMLIMTLSVAGCGQIPRNGGLRQLQPADPNQALLQLMQQKTLNDTLRHWDSKSQCSARKELSCDEILFLQQQKCKPQIIIKETKPEVVPDMEAYSEDYYIG